MTDLPAAPGDILNTVWCQCKTNCVCVTSLLLPQEQRRVCQHTTTATVTAQNSELECGPMPNVMGALPIIGGALCLTPQTLADAH